MPATVPVVAAASIDQRFAQLIQQFRLTKNSFAISLGKTASVVQHLIDGRNKPGFDLMCKVFEVYPNVSRDWLLLGRGPMLVGSNGIVVTPTVVPAQAVAELAFDPIDLADVAPRAARRPASSRLHSEEIAATLALATAVVSGLPAANASVLASVVSSINEPDLPEGSAAMLPLISNASSSTALKAPAPLVAAAPVRHAARPFRPAVAPVPRQVSESVAPAVAPVPAKAPITQRNPVKEAASLAPQAELVSTVPGGALPPSPPAASSVGGPEAYVAAAIHAQYLQHQLALAELRNQHLLEQQQMLREMLTMARQGMV